jgi:hypothetical protein
MERVAGSRAVVEALVGAGENQTATISLESDRDFLGNEGVTGATCILIATDNV